MARPTMDPTTTPAMAPPPNEVVEVAAAGYNAVLAVDVVLVEDILDFEAANELPETEFALELVVLLELVMLVGSLEITVIANVEVIGVITLARTAAV